MIAGRAIGTRGIALPRWHIVAGVAMTVAVNGGGGAIAPLVKGSALTAATGGGGSVLATIAKGGAFTVVAAGNGAGAASMSKGVVVSTFVTGGGTAFANIEAMSFSLFDAALPNGRMINGPGSVRGIAASPILAIAIKAIPGIH